MVVVDGKECTTMVVKQSAWIDKSLWGVTGDLISWVAHGNFYHVCCNGRDLLLKREEFTLYEG